MKIKGEHILKNARDGYHRNLARISSYLKDKDFRWMKRDIGAEDSTEIWRTVKGGENSPPAAHS